MSTILTPSTGATREGGDLRLNVLQVEQAHRILARAEFSGWIVATVIAVDGNHVYAAPDGADPVAFTWREIAGIVRPGANADGLVARLRAIDVRAEEAAKILRTRKYDALRAILDGRDLERSSAFIPGM